MIFNKGALPFIFSIGFLFLFSCTYYSNRSNAGNCYTQMMNNFSKDPKAAKQIDLMLCEILGKHQNLDLCSQPIEQIEGDIHFDVLPDGQINNIAISENLTKIQAIKEYISRELLRNAILRTTNDTLHICGMFAYNNRNCRKSK